MKNLSLPSQQLFFVAEISGNHLGSFERSLSLIDAAAETGAHAVKFQTFTPEKMTLNIDMPDFRVSPEHPLWGGSKLFDLYGQTQTPLDWHEAMFRRARDRGIIPFSSPFDIDSVDFLEDLNCPIYKIASLETSDLRLISYAASTGKPIVISTGATEFDEIGEAVQVCHDAGNSNVTLLVCTSSYPAIAMDANLKRMELLRETFGVQVGLSDHTLGIGVAVAAVALGATIIEKHMTLDRSDGGLDSAFSLEPGEFAMMVSEGTAASQAVGSREWFISDSEKESRRLRRSLYIVKDVEAGESVSLDNIAAVRPGFGLSPKFLNEVIGRKFRESYRIGTALTFESLE